MTERISSISAVELQSLRDEVAALRRAEALHTRADAGSRANTDLTRTILDSAVVGVIQFAPDSRVVYANAHAREKFHWVGRELTELSMDDFVWRAIRADGTPFAAEELPLMRCLQTGQPQPAMTIGVQHSDTEVFWGLYTAVPVIDPDSNRPAGAVVTFIDTGAQQRIEESLRHSEDRYRRLVDGAPDAIVVHRNNTLLYVNDAAVKLWGGTRREDLVGRNILDFVHPRYHEMVRSRVEQVVAGAALPQVEQLHLRLDRRVMHVEVTAMPCTYDGQPSVQAIVRDVTRRKRTERQVRRQREILKKFFNHIPALVGFIDTHGRITATNPEWRRVLGWGKELPLAELLEKCYPDPQQRERVVEYMQSGESGWRDFRLQVRDGRTLDISWANVVLSDGTRIGIGQDVTRRKQAEEELRRNKTELEERVRARTEELSQKNVELEKEIAERRRAELQLQDKQKFLERMLSVQERDRQLVAYEIHDTFLQDVIGALMFIDAFHDAREAEGDPETEPLKQARTLLRKSIDEARRMISGLRPPIIDEQGIVAAIQYLVSELNARGRKIHFIHSMAVDRFDPVLEAAMFRIVQEALTNCERHSGSHYYQVKITQIKDTIHLEIRDFGVGFDPEQIGEGHFGLQGIRERIRLVGGTVTIHSAPGEGTEVIAEIPILTDAAITSRRK